jgi:hypothetical protein
LLLRFSPLFEDTSLSTSAWVTFMFIGGARNVTWTGTMSG